MTTLESTLIKKKRCSSITYHESSIGFMSKDSTPATFVVRRTMGISQLYQVGVVKKTVTRIG